MQLRCDATCVYFVLVVSEDEVAFLPPFPGAEGPVRPRQVANRYPR